LHARPTKTDILSVSTTEKETKNMIALGKDVHDVETEASPDATTYGSTYETFTMRTFLREAKHRIENRAKNEHFEYLLFGIV